MVNNSRSSTAIPTDLLQVRFAIYPDGGYSCRMSADGGEIDGSPREPSYNVRPQAVSRDHRRAWRGLWNIWTKCNGFEGASCRGCLAIGRQTRLEFLPVAGHFHPTPHPPLTRHPRTHQPLQSKRLRQPNHITPRPTPTPQPPLSVPILGIYPRSRCWPPGWLMRGGSAFWAAGAAQQGHLLRCETSEHHDDDRLFLRHGSVSVALVSVALPGGHLAEGIDLFRYTRGALG